MKRNLSIELLKFIFAISIARGHFSSSILNGGIVVTLFFVLSGFFLVRSFDSGKYQSPWQYTGARLKRIYPYYIFAFLVFFTFVQMENILKPAAFISELLRSLPEIFLLQNVGIFPGGINYPLWQMCTLIVASHILFSLLKWNRQLVLNALCPVLALGTFAYLANTATENSVWGLGAGFIAIPLLRAAGGLAVGMFFYDPICRVVRKLEASEYTRMPLFISLLSVPVLLAFWVNRNGYAAVIPFLMLLVCLLYSKGIYARAFQLPVLARLDKLSLAVYLNHGAVIEGISVLRKVPGLAFLGGDIVYIVVLLVYSVIMLFVVDFLVSRAKRIFAGRQTAKA